jgi:Xaa-Pro dipeptidase
MSKDKNKKKRAARTAVALATGATPVIGWAITQDEYDERVERVREQLVLRKLDALVLFHPIRMAYTTGFFHLSTERPMAVVVGMEKVGAMVPWLEQEHIAKSTGVTNVKVYPEYPTGGTKHPLRHLADLLAEMGLNSAGTRLGADNDGYLDINGYDGPALSEVVADGVAVIRARDIVDKLRAVKSETELQFIIQASIWGNLAHQLMHERLELGRSEISICLEARAEASRMMIAALGPTYQQLTSGLGTPANVVFSAGARTAMPHGLSGGIGLRLGDTLVTYGGSEVGGYTSELERTMHLGEPTTDWIKHYGLMMQLQQIAFDALKPGRTLAEIETEVSQAFVDLGIAHMQRHHTGHGIGLEGHEYPFIDKGSHDVVLAENMVLSVEPGMYVPGLAGFRHSDTVVIRSHGAERLTFYPRDLESMIVLL